MLCTKPESSRFKNIKSILNSIGGADSSFQIATLETTLAYSAQAAWNLTPAHPVPHLFFLFFSHLLVLDVVEVVAPQAGKPRLNLDTLQAKKQTPLWKRNWRLFYSLLSPRVLSQTKQHVIFFSDSSTLKHFSFFSYFFQINSSRVEWDQKQNEKTTINSARESKKNITNFLTLTVLHQSDYLAK